MKNIKITLIALFVLSNLSFAEDDHKHSTHSEHNHSKNEKAHEDKEHDQSNHDNLDKHEDHNHSKNDNHKGHDHGSSKAIGKGKAIEVVDKKKGFKLSKEAIKTLNLKLKNVDGDEFEIRKNTLVTSKNLKGVYRFRAGFFKLLGAKIIKKTKSGYKVKVAGVDFGDQIVINGVGLLRVTDVYSTDTSEYGHSH